ncbi:MAG: InlB B-repeat-containing protein, partial [Clostridiales Family XIII bacterium]|nr:InlB B-repeat-containing protein [Clostridiales Family XIII bacterium]
MDTYIVTFKVAGVNPDKKIEVAKGELCPKQAPPKAPNGEVFAGWFYDELGAEQEFDFGTVQITKNLTVTAKFDVTGHTVQFLSGSVDDNDSVVVYSASVADGGTLSEISVDIPDKTDSGSGLVFTGKWLIDGVAADYFTFDSTQVNDNLKLVPEFALGYRIYFVTNGKTSIEPQVVLDGATISVLPTPQRDGYTFDGWHEDKDCNNPGYSGSAFNLSTPITSSTSPGTLYAKWNGNTVPYTLVYWVEKANIPLDKMVSEAEKHDFSNYEYVTSKSLTATAGSIFTETSGSNPIQPIAQTDTNLNAAKTANEAMKYSSYEFTSGGIVAGNGESVINVYYTRNIYTFVFDIHTNGTGVGSTAVFSDYNRNYIDNNAYILHDGETYQKPGTASENVKYSFQGKFDLQIPGLWPEYTEICNSTYPQSGWYHSLINGTPHNNVLAITNYQGDAGEATLIDGDPGNDYVIKIAPQWNTQSGLALVYRCHYLEATQAELDYISEQEITVPAHNATDTVGSEFRPYISYNNKTYVYHPEYSGSGYYNVGVQLISIPGFTFTSGLYNGNPAIANYSTTGNVGGSTVYHAYCVFNRNVNTLTLDVNSGTGSVSTPTQTIAYGDPIPTLPIPTNTNSNLTFVGWYSMLSSSGEIP